jgi:homotetrameric cytidine deaminase
MSHLVERAFLSAKTTRTRAYAPYSGFKVGAAIGVEESERIFTGCNVENASYGASICAERTALLKLVSDEKELTPSFLILVTEVDPAAVPCALCLQMLAEFCNHDFPIHLATLSGVQRTVKLHDLLPQPFVLRRATHEDD